MINIGWVNPWPENSVCIHTVILAGPEITHMTNWDLSTHEYQIRQRILSEYDVQTLRRSGLRNLLSPCIKYDSASAQHFIVAFRCILQLVG